MDAEFIDLSINLRKNRIFKEINSDVVSVNYAKEDIMKLIPHRNPFLFLDTIDKLSLIEQKAAGTFHLPADHDVFRGHFPDNPIFPGVLQVEMMGQLGLCLSNFVLNNTVEITEIKSSIKAVATHVRDAMFMHSLFPNDVAFIEVVIHDLNEINGVMGGQIYNNDNKLCFTAIMEVYYLE